MNKNIVIGVIAVFAIILIVLFAGGSGADNDGDIDRDRDELLGEEVTHADVRVETPRRGDTVSSPVTLQGEARGSWYFEASFSAKVTDNQGRVLAEVPVQAQGEWMTTDFVPFETTISWAGSTPEAGFIVLEKANPSGLAENAAEVRIPVYFEEGTPSQTQTVSVYFSSDAIGTDNASCDTVTEVTRSISPTQSVARVAINELLKGPTAQEAQGNSVMTNIPDGVELNSIRIEDSTAFVDFSEEMNNVGGSCRVTAIRAQIEETLLQFSTVDDVVISVEGNVEEALQP